METQAAARVQVIVENVPPDILEAVDEHAAETGRSINDVAVGLLADRYGIPYTGSSYLWHRRRPAVSSTWVLRMPPELRDAIAAHATARRGDSRRGVILLSLAEALGLPPVSPRRAA